MEIAPKLYIKNLKILSDLIAISSFSGEEGEAANYLSNTLDQKRIKHMRYKNNLWAFNKHFDPNKKTILLNSHHDTVKPNLGYKRDPFQAEIIEDKLFGLGSNDAGGSLFALLETFESFYLEEGLQYNLVLALTAEEENSGQNGIRSILNQLPKIDFAIVGEPTEMNMAISEKGLLVLDVQAEGISGHAAHFNTSNAIDMAMKDIVWFHEYQFPRSSKLLGDVKMTVTQIQAGKQHNIVPSTCNFVVDVRVNDKYNNHEIIEIIQSNIESECKPRSTHLNSSSIDEEHPIVQAGKAMGLKTYGSPTLSDQANLTCPSLKIGPGKSERSHSADEFIYLNEIEEGIKIYKQLLKTLLK
jgi:acetylornithine deacetylase